MVRYLAFLFTAAFATLPGALHAAKADAPRSTAASAPSTSKLTTGERKFVTEAAKGSMTEVELGKLASEKASAPDVKKFGEHMANDHGKANHELAQLATAKGLELPSAPDSSMKREADRLRKLGGEDFDRKYMGEMVKDHEKDVKEFRRMARDVKDPDLRGWVEKTLPVLEGHLKMAREVADATGAPRGARGNKSAQMNPAR
jgi:putative membrane protein